MEQKQVITYQKELFDINGQGVVSPFLQREDVDGAQKGRDLQVHPAGEQERALACNLMETVSSPNNIWTAYRQVKQNKGAGGVDGMQVATFADRFRDNGPTLIDELHTGKYEPAPVCLVEPPKPNGGVRRSGIPTVKDRVIQQATSQVPGPVYGRGFIDHSYGFRPGRSARQALQKAIEYVSGGRTAVADIDLKNFLDTVNLLTVSKQSIERIKTKVRQITRRNRGVEFERIISELNLILRGRLNYFRIAKCHKSVQTLDARIRRRLRCYRLKQCKRVHALQQFLHRQGVEKWQGWILALSGKGYWRKSGCPQSHQAMGREWFQQPGLYNLTFNYETFNHLQKPPCTKVRTVV